MVNEDLYQRISIVETKVNEHSKILDNQQEKNENQVELNTILKMHVEQMDKFGDTLNKVNDNLTHLNHKQEKLGERVTDIESTLHEQKTSRSERIKGSLKYIATGIGTLLIAYIASKLGI